MHMFCKQWVIPVFDRKLHAPFRRDLLKIDGIKRLKDVVLQIRKCFQPDGKADEPVADAMLPPLFFRVGGMSNTGGMLDERLGVAETYGTGHQGKSVREGHALFLAASQFASDQTTERRHLASCELMEGRR